MKTLKIASILVLFVLYNCASTSNVMYDYDESINFDNYSTFVLCVDDLFVENTKFPNYDNNYVRTLLADEFENQMKQLGHKTNVFEPQLQVGFKIVVKEEQTTFSNCDHQDVFKYWDQCTISTETYTKETIIAYVSDFEKNQVIWQATLSCDFNKSKNGLKSYVKEISKQLFEAYPKNN